MEVIRGGNPDLYREILYPAYEKIYVEMIVHHSDCYCANLVPYMIELGIDV